MHNLPPLEVVGRGSETQLQVGENLNNLKGLTQAKINDFSLGMGL